MNILLVHQNFPGQFKHLAPALGADPANRVVGFTMSAHPRMLGVQMVHYKAGRGSSANIHPWVSDIEAKVIRGEVAFKAARKMRDEHGFQPDIIFRTMAGANPCFSRKSGPKHGSCCIANGFIPCTAPTWASTPSFSRTMRRRCASCA